MKRQSRETGSSEIQTLQLAGKDFKVTIVTMLEDINNYAKNQ